MVTVCDGNDLRLLILLYSIKPSCYNNFKDLMNSHSDFFACYCSFRVIVKAFCRNNLRICQVKTSAPTLLCLTYAEVIALGVFTAPISMIVPYTSYQTCINGLIKN